jgi:hypothetical protein
LIESHAPARCAFKQHSQLNNQQPINNQRSGIQQ